MADLGLSYGLVIALFLCGGCLTASISDFQHKTGIVWTEAGAQALLNAISVATNCTGREQFCNTCLTVGGLKAVQNVTAVGELPGSDLAITLIALLANSSAYDCTSGSAPFHDQLHLAIEKQGWEEILHGIAETLNSDLVHWEEHEEGEHDHQEQEHKEGYEGEHEEEHEGDHEEENEGEHEEEHEGKHDEEHEVCFGEASLMHDWSFRLYSRRALSDEDIISFYCQTIINHILSGDILEKDCAPRVSVKDFQHGLIINLKGNSSYVAYEEVEQMLSKLGIGGAVEGGHADKEEDSHEGHGHKRSVRESLVSKCFTREELIEAVGAKQGDSVSTTMLADISIAAIQQIYNNSYCSEDKKVAETETESSHAPPAWESWGIGFLSVAIISALAVLGALLFPCLNHTCVQDILTMFIGLAVGTMAGDALLHLIPQAIGLHAHDGGHDHGSGLQITVEEYTWKMLVVVAAIYVFFLFETIMARFGHSHLTEGHSHENLKGDIPHAETLARINEISLEQNSTFVNGKVHGQSKTDLVESVSSMTSDPESDNSDREVGKVGLCNLPTVAYMIIFGDILHNFVDGLAMGAAFASGWRDGLTISIAVLCHELPHELGDFAVLLATGLSPKQVIVANTLSACCAFIGLFIGIPISSNETTRNWIFAATAGMFLYVSLVNMIPELAKRKSKSHCRLMLLQNAGLIIGFGAMFVIAVFEDFIAV